VTGTVPNVSTAGAPTIEFKFAGDTVTAELAGAKLYAEASCDERCDLRVTAADGFVLADLVVNARPERNLTENVMDIGSAILWSHWRFTQSQTPMSGDPEKHTAPEQKVGTAPDDVDLWRAKAVQLAAALEEALGQWASAYEDQRTSSQPVENPRIVELRALLAGDPAKPLARLTHLRNVVGATEKRLTDSKADVTQLLILLAAAREVVR
jgi:hypothetical protein